ncbi:MAG: hypothetical protein ACM32E_10290 [Gemmatimonadota bacterium]
MTEPRGSGPDPIGDFQRWLVRTGARSMSRELGGHIAGAFGLGGKSGDVWQTATAPPPVEAPECAWCPVCRAARLLRVSGPGLASHVAAASDTLASMIQDAATVVESALAAAGRRPGSGQAAGGAWDPGTLADWDVAGPQRDTPGAAGQQAGAPADPGADAEAAGTVWAEATGNGAGPGGHAAGGNGAGGNGPESNGPQSNGPEHPGSP